MRAALWLALTGCAMSSTTTAQRTPVAGDSPLAEIFARVGADTGVPADELAAVSWNETRFHFADALQTGLLGLMPRDVARGAALAGVTEDAVRTDAEASVRAAAMLIKEEGLRGYGGDSFAHAVEALLERGIDGRDDEGRRVVVAARRVRASGVSTAVQAVGYAGADWVPAYSGNYQVASRGVGDIKSIIIHDTEGSYAGTLSWFQEIFAFQRKN